MRRQKVEMAVLSVILTICFTSCSYKSFEDSIRNRNQEVSESTEEKYVNSASISDHKESEESKEEENNDTEKENESNVFEQEETVTSIWKDGEMQYTLNKTEIVQNIQDLNLSLEDFSFTGDPLIDESGNIIDSNGEKNYFIAAYVTVKNCNVDINEAETEYPLQIEMCSGAKSDILTPDGPFLNYAVYFSAHPQDGDINKMYYYFKLEPDSEMEAVIGWIVSESMLTEPYYYVINSFGTPEEYQYFLLNESQEEKS